MAIISERQFPRITPDFSSRQRDVLLLHREDLMAARSGLLHHRERGILVGFDLVERVENEGYAQVKPPLSCFLLSWLPVLWRQPAWRAVQ